MEVALPEIDADDGCGTQFLWRRSLLVSSAAEEQPTAPEDVFDTDAELSNDGHLRVERHDSERSRGESQQRARTRITMMRAMTTMSGRRR